MFNFFSTLAHGGKSTGPVYKSLLRRPVPSAIINSTSERLTIGAGCFWGVELAYQRIPGIIKTKVGYTQGEIKHPTYQLVCSGVSGHVEAVEIDFNPDVVSYKELLDVFWERHDATTLNRQGGDVGTQYRSGIYYHNEEQRVIAEDSKENHAKEIGKSVVTEILEAKEFYDAEEYHQQYLMKGGQCSAKGDESNIRCYG